MLIFPLLRHANALGTVEEACRTKLLWSACPISHLQARIVTIRHEQERARGHTTYVDIAQVASHQVVGWIERANQVSACQARALLKFPLERREALLTSAHDSSWVSSHSLSFPSAASESAIGGLSAAQRREVSGTASSAEKQSVLDPNGTSEDVAGRRG